MTKSSRAVVVAMCALLAVAVPQGALASQNPGFEKLKTLVGTWVATMRDGQHATVTYELVSAGSALLERLGGDAHPDMQMVTVYHPDGDRVVMTHYCSAGNQPRMKAEPVIGEVQSLRFTFLDATNLATPGEGHMHGLVVTFHDADSFTQEWTWRENGQEGAKVFHWSRAK
jgi:hypothetical protein